MQPVEAPEASGGRAPGFEPRGAVAGVAAAATGAVVADDAHEEDKGRTKGFLALRRSGAPKVATWDDLVKVRDSLRTDISSLSTEWRVELSRNMELLRGEVQELREKTSNTATLAADELDQRLVQAQSFTEGCNARLQQELQVVASNLEARIAESIQSTELALQTARMREVVRDDVVDQKISGLSAELTSSLTVRWASIRGLWEQVHGALRDDHEALRNEFVQYRETTQALTLQGFSEVYNNHAEKDKEQDAKLHSFETDLRGSLRELKDAFEEFRSTGEQKITANEEFTKHEVTAIKQETTSRLQWLNDQAVHIRELVKEVENIPTRRVEWLIRGASSRAAALMRSRGGVGAAMTPASDSRPSSRAGASSPPAVVAAPAWSPPGASAAAAPPVLTSPLFETGGASGLRLELRASEALYESEGGEGSCTGSGIGDCDLLLWCHHRLHIVCRLSIGNQSVQVEHTFDGSEPCVASRLATLGEQINLEDDVLRVSVEVLEVVREVAATHAEMPGGEVEEARSADSMTMYRYLNHRILELVENKVEVMRSRMVRRIEWRIDNASSLRQAFPEGECLCSTTFAAAGMEGLQLVFYPSGYAGAKEGFCSYYLYCPAGSALRCWLAIGKQRREARLVFERDGFYGRTNFCRFDFCIDPAEDAILLVLEIDEAQQNVTQSLAHEVAPLTEDRPPEKLHVGSRLTFKRTPGTKALEDVRQLPCIWTSRPQANLAEALEGFHALSDIRRKPLHKDGGRAPPAVLDRYMMYAT